MPAGRPSGRVRGGGGPHEQTGSYHVTSVIRRRRLLFNAAGRARGQAEARRCEPLEGRRLLTTFAVSSLGDPKYAAAYAALFDALDVENKRDQAMEASDQLTKLDPKEPRYARHFSRRGSILFERNDLDGQLAAFRKAAELDPKNAKYHYNVSVVLQKKGQVGEAIAACERAVELDPRDGKICLQLAWLLYVDPRFRDAGRAVALARKAIELTPAANVEGLTQRWQTLGWALYYAGDWKGSVAALERSMALQPSPKGGDPGQWFCLAMDHWQLGDQAEARRWYDRAVAWMEENNPEHTEFNGFRVEAGELLGVNEQ